MNLAKALRASKSPALAFVGAGGKTTAMFQLARELIPPVLLTATTHLGVWQAALVDKHILINSPGDLQTTEHDLNGLTLITGRIEGEKTEPVDDESILWLHDYAEQRGLTLLIEADGSRQRPLKAPAQHEPAIPEFVKMVVQVAGLNGLGKGLTDKNIHRPEIFARLSGLQTGEKVSSDALARMLLHPAGGLKNIPSGARRVTLLNQADTTELQAIGGNLARQLLPEYESVIVASLKQKQVFAVHERVAGIVLAAGASQRFGRTKQLLDWQGEAFVRTVAKTALGAGLSPVLVITGADAQNVEAAVQDLPVQIVRNNEWREGQASSIRAGISKLLGLSNRMAVGAAVFLLADQPQLGTSILSALVEAHSSSLPAILAPLVMDQRANPVLFDRDTFRDLLELRGDIGGRAIFSKYRIEYLPWHDERLLLDVDTPEHYARLITDNTP